MTDFTEIIRGSVDPVTTPMRAGLRYVNQHTGRRWRSIPTNTANVYEWQYIGLSVYDALPTGDELLDLPVDEVIIVGSMHYRVGIDPAGHAAVIHVQNYHRNFDSRDYSGYAENTGLHAPHGRISHNPGNVLDVFTQYLTSGDPNYTFDVAVSQTAFRAAKGSNEAAGDTLVARYTNTVGTPVTVNTNLDYKPAQNYIENGVTRLAFGIRGTGTTRPLFSLGGQDIYADVLIGSASLYGGGVVKALTPIVSDQVIANRQAIHDLNLRVTVLEP